MPPPNGVGEKQYLFAKISLFFHELHSLTTQFLDLQADGAAGGRDGGISNCIPSAIVEAQESAIPRVFVRYRRGPVHDWGENVTALQETPLVPSLRFSRFSAPVSIC